MDRDNAPRLGASVASYTLLSFAPVIVIAVALAAVVYGEEAARGRLTVEVQGVAGAELARIIQETIRNAYTLRTGVIATLLGLVTLLFGASSIFVELHEALNTIRHVSPPPDNPVARQGGLSSAQKRAGLVAGGAAAFDRMGRRAVNRISPNRLTV